MQIMTRLMTAILILVSLTGCRRAPQLVPRLILQGEPVGNDFWLAAPYVLAVKIVGADLQGSPELTFRGGPATLQLVRFVANVENVIKGDLPDKKITFFFFLKLDQNPRYYLDPGKRYIVSLRSEGGLLRSWADATQLKIWVHSGSHDQKDLPIELGPGATIAYILFTPGADCDLKEFGNTLGMPPQPYGETAYVNGLLKRLQRHPDRFLRDSACLTSATLFGDEPRCLEQCLDNPDGGIRLTAAEHLKEDSTNLLEWLRENPSGLFPKPWIDYMTQMLEIYAEDIRPEVRKAACESLRRLTPQQAVEQCRVDVREGRDVSRPSR